MNPSSIDEINNSLRGVIASVTNNSHFVLLLDVHDDVGYASHGKARADKLAVLPGEKFPQYFGGNSIGAGVEVCFRFGVWDCAKDFENLPDQSVAAKRNWIDTRMRVDQFGTSRIIKAVGGEKLTSQRVANLFVMFDVPKVGVNWICVTEGNSPAVMWEAFSKWTYDFKYTYEKENTVHQILKPVYLSGTYSIASGTSVTADITISNGPGFI